MTAHVDRRAPPGAPHLLALLALLVLCVGGGAAIGLAFAGRTAAYGGYELPAWAPPAWLFAPVWTVLYTLMAVSAWLVWRTPDRPRGRALMAFGVQLLLNFAWTPAFFGAGSPPLGLAVIGLLVPAVGWWVVEARRLDGWAGVLQFPYLAWTGFAAVLNLAIVLGG
jgi:translocator protein